jgi:hypothetical protein
MLVVKPQRHAKGESQEADADQAHQGPFLTAKLGIIHG